MKEIKMNGSDRADECPCGSDKIYDQCCEPLIKGKKIAKTAEQLMRSRYSAYVKKEISYLRFSLDPKQQVNFNEIAVSRWANNAVWNKLQIIKIIKGTEHDSEGKVEFVAWYLENGSKKIHHEISLFRKISGVWYYIAGEYPKVGRNDHCICGSRIKFKKCCGKS